MSHGGGRSLASFALGVLLVQRSRRAAFGLRPPQLRVFIGLGVAHAEPYEIEQEESRDPCDPDQLNRRYNTLNAANAANVATMAAIKNNNRNSRRNIAAIHVFEEV